MKWNSLLKIREQRVSQAQRSLVAARAEEARCEAAYAQVQQRIEKLQRALQYNSLATTNQPVPLDQVLIGQQHWQSLRQQMDQEIVHLQQTAEMLAKARQVSTNKADEYLLMQRKLENTQQQLGSERRDAAKRAAEVEEEFATEQWLAND
ncbi:MAG: hypothetical protein ACR2P1_16285 [Pseudomonadales bacterium]